MSSDRPTRGAPLVIVAGHLVVDPRAREGYLAGCVPVILRARRTPGCLDFSLSADLVDPTRVNVFERWASRSALEGFRGDGPSDDQQVAIRSAEVIEHEIADVPG